MIVRVKPSGFVSRRRAAFTLVEVLVVVAIVVILASVGTIATLTFLEGAREDTARAKANQLQTYAKAFLTKNNDQYPDGRLPNLGVLADMGEDGQRALIDPWGNEFLFDYIADPAKVNGEPRLFIYSKRLSDGKVFGSPKELEAIAMGQ